jgi:urease alpha subunit
MLHLDARMGSVKVGKDADVVLWSDHPLSIYARPEYTFVDGRELFSLGADAALRADLQKERQRLVQAMLAAKKGGAPTQTAPSKAQGLWHCDTMGQEKEAAN